MSHRQTVAVSALCYIAASILCSVALAGVPDPVTDPVESVSLVVSLWKGGTIPAALIVAVFLGLTVAARSVPWLARGYAAIISASVLAGLAVIIEPASRGTTPTAGMIISALFAAVALALKGKGEMPPREPAVPVS